MFNLRARVTYQRPRQYLQVPKFSNPVPLNYRPSRCHTTEEKGRESLDITHSRFLVEASPRTKWHRGGLNGNSQKGKPGSPQDDLVDVTDTRGKLSPTSSHLFKLILPLGSLSHPSSKRTIPVEREEQPKVSTPPTIFLLHPSQPLSHVSRLILASLAPATPSISFRSVSSQGQAFQWSDSTDVGDFIRDAAHAAEFTIGISYDHMDERQHHLPSNDPGHPDIVHVDAAEQTRKGENRESSVTETLLIVTVPTFGDRTRFLRRRLNLVEVRMTDMEGLKQKCDQEAHQGARKMALGGFGMLLVYWGAVARLTFWDYGWEVMEPITYLSGLSTVILGYLWFLYQGREVSYTSVLARSISARREALYKAHGFDIEHWMDLVAEKKALRAEISRIARDYEGDDENGDASKAPSGTGSGLEKEGLQERAGI